MPGTPYLGKNNKDTRFLGGGDTRDSRYLRGKYQDTRYLGGDTRIIIIMRDIWWKITGYGIIARTRGREKNCSSVGYLWKNNNDMGYVAKKWEACFVGK